MEKKSLHLQIAFVGRIHPIKNLLLVLDILEQLKGEVKLEIAGVIEDRAYWNECLGKISKLPENIKVYMMGEMGHEAVLELVQNVHILFLPTKGENFGHAILEALAAGKPVVISDQTPWRNLAESHAGYDLALQGLPRFREVLQAFVDMDQDQYSNWSVGARNYLEKKLDHDSVIQGYKNLFG
jgi:glycosyltransferase involved in cell wall biosynthesis